MKPSNMLVAVCTHSATKVIVTDRAASRVRSGRSGRTNSTNPPASGLPAESQHGRHQIHRISISAQHRHNRSSSSGNTGARAISRLQHGRKQTLPRNARKPRQRARNLPRALHGRRPPPLRTDRAGQAASR